MDKNGRRHRNSEVSHSFIFLEKIVTLLAEDDPDDRSFFNQALTGSDVPAELTTIEDDQQFIHFLSGVTEPPPPEGAYKPFFQGNVCFAGSLNK